MFHRKEKKYSQSLKAITFFSQGQKLQTWEITFKIFGTDYLLLTVTPALP